VGLYAISWRILFWQCQKIWKCALIMMSNNANKCRTHNHNRHKARTLYPTLHPQIYTTTSATFCLLRHSLSLNCYTFSGSWWLMMFIVNSPCTKTVTGIIVHGIAVLIRQHLQGHCYLQTDHTHAHTQVNKTTPFASAIYKIWKNDVA